MGAVPESYAWFRAAKYIGCTPWELIERDDGVWWRNEALATERNETLGNEARAKMRGMKGQRLQA